MKKIIYMLFGAMLSIAGGCSSDKEDEIPGSLDEKDLQVVEVEFDGANATVTVPSGVTGVTYTVTGADVTITSMNTEDEITYRFQGSSSAGSVVYNGSYKCTFILENLNLTSDKGSAFDIECGKRIAIVLPEGSVNSLEDSKGGSQKAALYCKGHIEFSGAGTLSVVGNTSHAISTKEYCELKDDFGSLNITSAEKDGMHVGQYFLMEGGKVVVSGVKGDGIQAEQTSDANDENNGWMMISGGELQIGLSNDDSKGLKSDVKMNIDGGTITISAAGNGSRGIQTKGEMNVAGGVIDIVASGNKCQVAEDASDPHKCMGIKTEGNLTVSGGAITVKNTGKKSVGIKVGGVYRHLGGKVDAEVNNDGSDDE